MKLSRRFHTYDNIGRFLFGLSMIGLSIYGLFHIMSGETRVMLYIGVPWLFVFGLLQLHCAISNLKFLRRKESKKWL